MASDGDLIAHRPRQHEQTGLFAKHGSDSLLERVGRFIVAEHVVAERCGLHCLEHFDSRVRRCITPEVDYQYASEGGENKTRSSGETDHISAHSTCLSRETTFRLQQSR